MEGSPELRIAARLRLPGRDAAPDLLALRRVGPLPAWGVGAMVVALYLATIAATLAEFRAGGTVFGYPGPAFFVLLAPIVEELVFRGWLLGRLERALPPAGAIATSSLLFGLHHVRNVFWREPAAVLGQVLFTGLVLGPLLAYVTLRGRSVWPAVVLHYLNNLTWYLR